MEYSNRDVAKSFAASNLSDRQLNRVGWVLVNNDGQFYEGHKQLFNNFSISWGGVGDFAAKFKTKDQAKMRQMKFLKWVQLTSKIKYWDGQNLLYDEPVKEFN